MDTIPIESILVSDRQRQDLGDLDRDFASVKEIGLIQPIVVDVLTHNGNITYKLKVGGRRLAWLKANGFTTLYHGSSCDPKRPGYILSVEVNERQRQEAELVENINRHKLNWREECCAIARVHRLRWIEHKADALEWSQKHTARLLNIDGYAKVAYALQIADELRDNPEGELSKCERYTDALKLIHERLDRQARAEQERRRDLLRKIEERLLPENQEGNIQTIPGEIAKEIFEQPPQRETVWLSNMLFHGDFSTIASTDFPPDLYPCVLVFNDNVEWKDQAFRLLRVDSYTILFNNWTGADEVVLWNQLDLPVEPGKAFRDSTVRIGILHKGQPQSPCPSPTNVITANPEEGEYPPASVLDFVLRATTLPGASIICPTGAPVGVILALGRRPITFETDEKKYEKNMEEAKAYYTALHSDQVDFK